MLGMSHPFPAQVANEHGATVDALVLIKPRTIAKTTSGKIARKRCKQAHATGALRQIFALSARDTDGRGRAGGVVVGASATSGEREALVTTTQPAADGALARGGVVADLATDLAALSRRSPESISATLPLADTGIDSLDLAQFKGVLDNKYGVRGLPDDLLFRDDTTLLGLAKVVEAGGAFDEAAYASALAALEIDRSQGGGKKKGDFMVENCPCLLVCCPSKLRK